MAAKGLNKNLPHFHFSENTGVLGFIDYYMIYHSIDSKTNCMEEKMQSLAKKSDEEKQNVEQKLKNEVKV